MSIAVDAESMSVLVDLPDQLRISLHMFSYQKERSADFVPCQRLQHLRGVFRVWTIVEGQRDLAAETVSLPQDGGISFLLGAIEAETKGVSHLEYAE